MLSYTLRRILSAAVVVLLLLAAVSVLVHILPGDPVRLMLGPKAPPALSARAREEMGLDSSIPAQIWDFIVGAAHGDLGRDFVSREPVMSLIGKALPHTLLLAVGSLCVAIVGSLLLGVVSANRPGGWLDRIVGTASVGILSIPAYVVGLLLLLVFAVQLEWFPAIGTGDLTDPLDYLSHLVLPVLSLALVWVGYLARIVRSSMLEVLSTNYIRSARAYGIPRRRVLYQLALRNAMMPVVALLGIALGELIGSAIFIEVIFTRDGLGTLVYNAITDRNYPVIRGGVVTIAVLFVVANLLADLANRALDPRTKEGAAS
ncbi:ABC transporter permease [Nocardioidaceae bacterium SCSIO 66511]|nr:ABC transporter permease [Nocardioidaceae bacterium SCSIO 66511]